VVDEHWGKRGSRVAPPRRTRRAQENTRRRKLGYCYDSERSGDVPGLEGGLEGELSRGEDWKENSAEAELLLREVLAIRRKLLRDDHPALADTLRALGALVHFKGDYVEAERLLHEALMIYRKLFDAGHASVVFTIRGLGTVLRDKGELDKAEPLLRAALESLRNTRGDEDPRTAFSRSHLGDCLTRMGRYDEAERELLQAIRILDTDKTPGRTRETMDRLVALYEAWDKADQAFRWRAKLSTTDPSNVRGR